jgi:hypothetical protein
MRETDLFQPVKIYLEANGYAVHAEVKNCDITATKGDQLLIIELKLNVNIPLLIQASDRQKITDSVYVAVPRPEPGNRARYKQWTGVKHILRRLELGLIFVDTRSGAVEVAFHPMEFERRKQRKRRRSILQEVEGRSRNLNTGGSTRRKIITAYRLNALGIAMKLSDMGPSKPKDLRASGTGDKTLSILSSNFYGWFQRIEKGVYDITSKGKKALREYKDMLKKNK